MFPVGHNYIEQMLVVWARVITLAFMISSEVGWFWCNWLQKSYRLPAPLNGPGTQSCAADTQAGAVRAAVGQWYDRSVSVPGEHFNAKPGGGRRVSADKPTEDSEVAGHPAEPRAPGLRHVPAVSGGVHLASRQTAAGAPDATRTQLNRWVQTPDSPVWWRTPSRTPPPNRKSSLLNL